MTDFPSYTLGTVSVSNGDVAIVGDGTIWSGVNARAGDTIVIGTSVATIIDVTDDTHLKIDAWPFATVAAGTSYKIIQNSPLRFVGGQAMADVSSLIAVLRDKGLLWYLPAGYSQPSDVTPALTADDGQAILKIDTGALWVMQGGSWVSAGTFKGFNYKGAYNAGTAYAVNDILTDGGTAYIVTASTTGNAPPNASYYDVFASKGDKGEQGEVGPSGFDGDDAWTPELAVEADGSRRVLKVLSWFGGTGLAPAAPVYVGDSGYVTDVVDAATIGLTTADTPSRNFIVNSSMGVSQENGTTAVNLLSPASTYVLDQWHVDNTTDAVATGAQVASVTPGGNQTRLRVSITTGDTSVGSTQALSIRQPLEGIRTSPLLFGTAGAKAVSIRFGFKGPAGTYSVGLRNSASDRSIVGEFTIASGEANTDVVKSVSFSGDSTGAWPATEGVRWGFLIITLACGSTYQAAPNSWVSGNYIASTNQTNNISGTNVFELFDVALYSGSVLPLYEPPDPGRDRADCQRFYTNSFQDFGKTDVRNYGVLTGAAATIAYGNVSFPVQMAFTPSITFFNPSNSGAPGEVRFNGANLAVTSSNVGRDRISSITVASGGFASAAAVFHYEARARLS